MRYYFLPLLFLFCGIRVLNSQVPNTKYAIEAMPLGGKEELEQVLQTQLTLPKTLLTSGYDKEITAYFEIDSIGRARNITFTGMVNNVLRYELKRVIGLMRYTKTQNEYNDPYFLNFNIATDKYNRYFKQKYKLNLKKEAADSSGIIYSRGDRAPEYYKNGEQGMEEYVLSSMEYPKLAIEKSVEGTVVIDFVVETNGYVTQVTVRQALGAGCSEEALRVIKQSRWQPGLLNNKLIRYKTSYPITFSLRNVGNDNSSSSKTLGQ